jgi:sulfur carrier protein
MKVVLNGEKREVDDGSMVADVVSALAGARRSGIAVAVNGAIVPRSEWASAPLGEDDVLEVVSAIGGG